MTTRAAEPTADVVIVGGGPTGLMLAAELRLGGADPVVLERLPEISQIPKGNGLIGQIVPTLDYRGLADRFRADATYAGPVPRFPFGSLQLDFSRLGRSPLDIMAIPQRKLERVLDEWLHDLGGGVRRGHEVRALSRPGDGSPVMLDVRGPDGDYQVRTRYLAGCDGAHSLVRKQAGIGFPGVTSSEISRIGRVFLPTVRITPDRGHADVPGVGLVPLMMTTQTPRGAYSLAPLTSLDKTAEPGMFIFFTREDDSPAPDGPDVPMTLGELRESACRVLGADVPMSDPQWLTRTVGNSRQADRYRAGPVLLAGDAAHVFGAGGSLNAGLLDAVNLGWKLAAQVAGWAPAGLLDSYHAERHPAGQRAILQTRAQRALSASGEYAAALRELFGELMQFPEPLRHLGMIMEGSDVRYEVPADGTRPHPLAGRFAPDLRLDTGGGVTRVAELVRPARGVLLDLSGPGEAAGRSAPGGSPAGTLTADSALAGAASGWHDRVSVTAARPLAQPAPAAAMLIRPDGYVAWAAGPGTAGLADGLPEALRAWFGEPGGPRPGAR
ncbi:MAG TPA: FAD-dependent monooxygenase [Streptosporangiaceae bacterium]|nr:FAD-dependent monooxygenase [Streptosporangiaceae bacterium]